MKIIFKERFQFLIFLYLSLGVAAFTLILSYIDYYTFSRFLGNIDPLLAILITILTGFSVLKFLLSKTQFAIYKKHNFKTYFIVTSIVIVFGIEVIASDIWLVDYSPEINITFPKSILFYLSMGYIVEVFFHLLPISLIIIILTSFRKFSINRIVWISIITVSIIEPLFQIWFTDHSLTTTIYTGIDVYLFSLAQY